MGVITLTLISAGTLPSGSNPPLWVVITAGLAIGLGTYLGGWRIIRTMGKGLTDIESPQGWPKSGGARRGAWRSPGWSPAPPRSSTGST